METIRKSRLFQSAIVLLLSFTVLLVRAAPQRTTYQAKIIKPDGHPLEATSVNFKFTILDPTGSCILFAENYSSVNMTSTGGLISFSLGSGIKTYPASTTTFADVFSNITPVFSCDAGGPGNYSPTAHDVRKLVVQFHDGNGWQTLPAMNINAVPYAMYADEAQKLSGLAASDFVQASAIPTCVGGQALYYNGTNFSCVVAGGGVTSSTITAALGYAPADGASITALSSSFSSVSSTVFSVSSTVSNLSNTVSNLAVAVSSTVSSQWMTSGANIHYISGNIGIGTSDPTTKLDVNGQAQFKNANTQIILRDTDEVAAEFAYIERNNTALMFGTNNGSSSTIGMTIKDGRVGIGTSAPEAILNVNGAIQSGMQSGLFSNLGSNSLAFQRSASAGTLSYIDQKGIGGAIMFRTSQVTSQDTQVMTLTASGNVGIGTSSPQARLDVNGSSVLRATGVGQATWMLSNSGVAGRGGLIHTQIAPESIVSSSSGFKEYTAGTGGAGTYYLGYVADLTNPDSVVNRLTVGPTGLVGLGTNTPIAKLEVNGSISSKGGDIILQRPVTGGGWARGMNYTPDSSVDVTNDGFAGIGVYGASVTAQRMYLSFGSSPWASVSGIQITSIGNVGIGTLSPVTRLEVSGGIRISMESATCAVNYAGTLRYNAGVVEFCNGSAWSAFGVSGAGLQSFNGSTSATQTFTYGNTGNAPTFVTANGVHTLNIPLASAGTTTAGLISNADYVNFNSKISSQWNTSGATINYTVGNIGVGTATPNFPLHISASSPATLMLQSNNFLGADGIVGQLMFQHGGNSTYRPRIAAFRESSDSNVGLLFSVAKPIGGGLSTTFDSMFINPYGYVGIGTMTPTAKLHLSSGTSLTASLKLTSGTLLTSPQSGTIEYDGFNYYITDGSNIRRAIATELTPGLLDNTSDISNSGNITLTPTASVIVSSTAASINSQTGALIVKGGLGVAENIYASGSVIASGNIGVGTSTPAEKLHVVGKGVFESYQVPGINEVIKLVDSANVLVDRGVKAGFYVASGVGSNRLGAEISAANEASLTSTYLTFNTETSGTVSEKVRITGAGNMGIGTSAPLAALQVTGLGKGARGLLNLNSISASERGTLAKFGPYTFANTDSPGSFYWNWGARFDGEANQWVRNYTTGNNFLPYMKLSTTSKFSIGGAVSSSVSDANPTLADKFTVDLATGNVGIETISPQELLHVGNGTNKFALFNLNNGGTIPASNMGLIIGSNNSNVAGETNFWNGFEAATTSFDFKQKTGSGTFSTLMTLKPSGNIGIGTTGPTEKLHVAGNAYVSTKLAIATSPSVDVLTVNGGIRTKGVMNMTFGETSYGTVDYMSGKTRIHTFGSTTASAGAFSVLLRSPNGSIINEAFLIDSSGNVGIGTIAPIYKLDVSGTVNIASGSALRFGGTSICTSAGCTSVSDKNLKENIQPLNFSLNKILALQGVQYDWKDKFKYGEKHQVGFLAQDLEKVFPEVVYTDRETQQKSVSYGQLIAPLVEAFKAFHKTVMELFTVQAREMASLKKENEELKQRLDKLEQVIQKMEAKPENHNGK